MKRKAKELKESRDYSFLFSDDAELPVPIKVPSSLPTSRGSHSRPGSSTKGQAQTKPGSVISSKTHKQGSKLPTRKSVPVDHRKKLTKKPHSSSKLLTSVPKEQRIEQRKVHSNETKSSLKHHRMISKPPLKQAHQLKKKKKVSEKDEEALRMVREMCKTDRFAGRDLDDYDDRGMEATLEDIIKEEKRRYIFTYL